MADTVRITRENAPGKRIVLTPEIVEAITAAMRAGASQVTCAERLGISEATVKRWLQRGRAALAVDDDAADDPENTEQIYARLATEVPKATASAEVALSSLIVRSAQGGVEIENRRVVHPDGTVETIRRVTPPDWRAAAFVLDRRMGNRWSRSSRVEVSGGIIPDVSKETGDRLVNSLEGFLQGYAARQAEDDPTFDSGAT